MVKNQQMIVCRWHGCGKATKTISSHLAKRHVPSGEKSYACEWEGCSRQKAPFFKRSAIIKHLKLHIRTLGVDDLDLITTENGDPVLDQLQERRRRLPGEAEEYELGAKGFESRANLASGDAVWARVMGYPWWPAKIVDPFENSETLAMLRDKDAPVGSMLVYLFGVERMFWVADPYVLGYQQYYEQLSTRCTLKLFHTSMKEMREYRRNMGMLEITDEIIENPQSMDVDEIEQSSSDFPSESVKNDTPIVEVKTETA